MALLDSFFLLNDYTTCTASKNYFFKYGSSRSKFTKTTEIEFSKFHISGHKPRAKSYAVSSLP